MNEWIVAFITGLTTGGLSCLAVQGGLLASSLERQIEQSVQDRSDKRRSRGAKPADLSLAPPILAFLVAKLAAYTLLGALLGALGSVLQLNTTTRAILLVAVGVFMLGNALRMLNVHPIFRYFVLSPPAFITRYIRRTAKKSGQVHPTQGDNLLAPLFLGALTVFIPCGVTQAMMAVAVGSGSALQGAALMFAFTLGTSPVFFLAAWLTLRLGARLEKWFLRFVAVVILVLGLVSINSGLTLAGSPLSLQLTLRGDSQGGQASLDAGQVVASTPAFVSDGVNIYLEAGNFGYSPGTQHAKAETAVTLNVVTERTTSCARAFVIPALGVEQILPETGTVSIAIPPQAPGTVLPFTCSMGMYTGEIIFDQ